MAILLGELDQTATQSGNQLAINSNHQKAEVVPIRLGELDQTAAQRLGRLSDEPTG